MPAPRWLRALGFAPGSRGSLVWRLYLLGSIQLVLLATAVAGVGEVLRRSSLVGTHDGPEPQELRPAEGPPPAPPFAEPPDGPPPMPVLGPPPPPSRHHRRPPLPVAPLLTFLFSGLVIVGVGSVLTARWIVQPMLRAERELLANVSHELRTPLARVRVALDIAGEASPEAGRLSMAEMAADLSEIEGLIDDILTAARLDAGDRRGGAGFSLHKEPVSPASLAERSADRFRARHVRRPLEVHVEEPLPDLDADAILLRRALDNLLDNAHKYSPDPDAPVTLRATAGPRGVVFSVEDRGIGIAPDDQRRLFTPFFRAERSRSRATGGVGLGLAIAKRVVEAHGGRVDVESALGKGTTMRLTVPARSRAAASELS